MIGTGFVNGKKVYLQCTNCKYNFDGVCVSQTGLYNYGQKIENKCLICGSYKMDFELYFELLERLPQKVKWEVLNDEKSIWECYKFMKTED